MSVRYHFSQLAFTLLQSSEHVYSDIRSADKFCHQCIYVDAFQKIPMTVRHSDVIQSIL